MKQKGKNNNSKKGINPVALGAMGAATAIAAGTAVMLSDKKRRKKVGKALNQLGRKGKEWVEKAQTTLNDIEGKLGEVNKRIPSGGKKRIAARA